MGPCAFICGRLFLGVSCFIQRHRGFSLRRNCHSYGDNSFCCLRTEKSRRSKGAQIDPDKFHRTRSNLLAKQQIFVSKRDVTAILKLQIVWEPLCTASCCLLYTSPSP